MLRRMNSKGKEMSIIKDCLKPNRRYITVLFIFIRINLREYTKFPKQKELKKLLIILMKKQRR
jgi:hypothetical protein